MTPFEIRLISSKLLRICSRNRNLPRLRIPANLNSESGGKEWIFHASVLSTDIDIKTHVLEPGEYLQAARRSSSKLCQNCKMNTTLRFKTYKRTIHLDHPNLGGLYRHKILWHLIVAPQLCPVGHIPLNLLEQILQCYCVSRN